MTREFANEREAWEIVWGQGGIELREKYQRIFRNLHPEGHRDSIRNFVRSCSTLRDNPVLREHPSVAKLLKTHPRAFIFLADHGTDYRPFAWKKMPEFGLGDPLTGECFGNSWRLMAAYNKSRSNAAAKNYPKWLARGRAVYVEGICAGSAASPMLHAWNAFESTSKIAFDWTHAAASRWSRYLGFPVSEFEYEAISQLVHGDIKKFVSIFDDSMFEIVEPLLLSIVEKRSKQDEKAA